MYSITSPHVRTSDDDDRWELHRVRKRVLKKLLNPTYALILILCVTSVTLLDLWRSSSTATSAHGTLVLSERLGQSSAITTSSRRLHATPPHQQLLARPPSQLHMFLVFDPDESGASPTLRNLEPYLAPYRQYPEAVTIAHIAGAAAVSVAAQFSIPAANLPAVVYLPPMWQNGPSLKQAPSFSLGTTAAEAAGFKTWAKSVARMTLLLMNDWDDNEVCFYYVSNDDKHTEVQISCPAVRGEVWQEVSLLDSFTARNKTEKTLLAQHVALFTGAFVVHPPGFCNYLVHGTCEMAKLPHPTDQTVLKQRADNEQRRADWLRDQPHQFKHYTPVGFEKRRAPQELFQALSGYLNASWENVAREIWSPDDIFTNHFDAPAVLLPLPWNGKLTTRIVGIVQRLLEDWIGGIPLESTAIYGIRIYTTGSTLAMHCDRPDTHIVSAIINVAQDVEEDWPLQILDHAGKAHSVNMQPGELTMYEGATCAHGREIPMRGRYFANVFVHFKAAKQQVAIS